MHGLTNSISARCAYTILVALVGGTDGANCFAMPYPATRKEKAIITDRVRCAPDSLPAMLEYDLRSTGMDFGFRKY
jgi:hypothetical protein